MISSIISRHINMKVLILLTVVACAAASYRGRHGHHEYSNHGSIGGRYQYHGFYDGRCAYDGFYYKNEESFVVCTNGNSFVQACAPGTENSDAKTYSRGTYYENGDFCDVNLVDNQLVTVNSVDAQLVTVNSVDDQLVTVNSVDAQLVTHPAPAPVPVVEKKEEPKKPYDFGRRYEGFGHPSHGYGRRDYGHGRRDYGRRDYGYGGYGENRNY
jgi:hypothetical protein